MSSLNVKKAIILHNASGQKKSIQSYDSITTVTDWLNLYGTVSHIWGKIILRDHGMCRMCRFWNTVMGVLGRVVFFVESVEWSFWSEIGVLTNRELVCELVDLVCVLVELVCALVELVGARCWCFWAVRIELNSYW